MTQPAPLPEEPLVPRISIRQIVVMVARAYDLSVCDLLSARTARAVSQPRHIAMWLCRELTTNSYPAIAQVFCRDHTTVMDGCRKIDARVLADAGFAFDVVEIRQRLAEGANGTNP